MIISKTTDLKMLKRMEAVAESQIKRCLDVHSDDLDNTKAKAVKVELAIVKLRIKELTN